MSAGGADRRSIGLLSVGHTASALAEGAVLALLPFLTQRRGLSFAAAATLVPAVTVASAIALPVLGHLADRTPRLWPMPAGVALSGVGVSLVGVLTGYPATILAVLVTGLGVAVFQPYAARLVREVAGTVPAFAMSVYAVGGNVGFAVAPLVVVALVGWFGLEGTLLITVPTALAATALALGLRAPWRSRADAAGETTDGPPSAPLVWPLPKGFGLLLTAIGLRSLAYFGLVAFVPLYWVGALDASPAAGNGALTVVLVAGVAGTLLVGRLGDRIDPRAVLAGAMALSSAGTVALLLAPAWGRPALLALIGAAAIGTFGLTVVMGQRLLPDRLGTAAGMTLGVSLGLGGLGAPLLGLMADGWGLTVTLCAVAGLSLAAAVCAAALPPSDPR